MLLTWIPFIQSADASMFDIAPAATSMEEMVVTKSYNRFANAPNPP